MKAQEVLRQYAEGKRDFRHANLRGANFKGQDLSDSDFSGADIRSANFANAALRGADFTSVNAGLQRRWMVVQLLIVILLAGVAGVLQGLVGGITIIYLHDSNKGTIGFGIYLVLIVVIYTVIALQGLTIQILGSILIASVGAGIVIGLDTGLGTGLGTVPVTVTVAVAVVSLGTIAGAVAVTGLGAVAVTVAVVSLGTIAGTVAVAGLSTVAGIVAAAGLGVVTAAAVVAVTSLLLSFYVGQQVLKENKKFAIVRMFGLAIAAVGGTTFCGADLTEATFNQSHLNNTNFANARQRETVLTRVCWCGAKRLNRARLGSSILQDRRVRTVLTRTEKGYKQNFTDANFRGANLSGVTLEGANLKRAILSNSLLTNAVLKNAILTEAQAINADFTGVCLTGATLEAWNIDSSTTLKNIDCQYVFLRETLDEKGTRERRPHNPNKLFQPGDFEKFFKEMLDDVQILIRKGIDPIAFRAAFQNIMEQHPDITEDAIKGIEKQGEDVLLTLQVPEGTDKAKIERDWDSGYRAGLKAGRERERLESAPKFEKLAFLLAEKETTIYNRNDMMTGNDHSRRIDIQGNVNQSSIIAGDNNQVSNQINQLGETETQAQLKDLLTQLKTAIESEPDLSQEEKSDALEEVGQLAAAGQSPQDGPMKKAAKRSLNVIKGITLGLGETTKLAETTSGLLKAIALLFGL